jgi:hypothetical protein
MRKHFFLLLLASALFSLQSCASLQQNGWLSKHRSNLESLAASNLSAEQKLDGLISDYVLFLNQDLKFADPRKGIKFVQKYHDQNLASIEKILKGSEVWKDQLNLKDKVAFGIRIVQKPYLKDLIKLGPKFKRKYKEYEFAVKMAARISGGITKLAGKNLED